MSDFREVALDFLRNLFSFDQAHPLLFTQFYFWAFFAFVMAFLCLFRNKTLMRNAFLFFASLFFYYKTSGLFIILFGFVIVYNYLTGRLLPHCRRRFWKGLMLFLGIAVDLSLLFYYKYAYFLTDVVNNLFGTGFEVKDYFAVAGNLIAGHNAFSVDSIFLPVGISFFTFQAISYIVDVYRGRYALLPVRNFFDFGFYLSFFPQLVAGPIVRADEFIPQLRKPFFLTRRQFGIAIFWILNGLAKKLIMSDFIAISLCDRVFENPTLYTGFENLLAMFCYSLQIYADFSGYTDIAIGTAMLMGFYLPKNFNSPYKATNMSVFWKRWHISLSRWLKDYLYIPLGGNRKGTVWSYLILVCTGFLASALNKSWWMLWATLALTAVLAFFIIFVKKSRKELVSDVNRMDTMLLGGLWHGASWNFMIWGGLNGLGMIIYRFWSKCNVYVRAALTAMVSGILYFLATNYPSPAFNLFLVWILVIFTGSLVHMLYHSCGFKAGFKWLANAWAVFNTFVFFTFTMMFFRSGSNIDPAEANAKAWENARNIIARIGGPWDLSLIPKIAAQHRVAIILFIVGMLIHWLPDRFKRRYRIWFANMPLPLMVLVCALVIFIICQFLTADLQSFIYFQF
jgi:Predicted membrane protein involved in D-alanine export